MKRLFLIFALLSYGTITDAQTKSDEEAVRALPRAFCDAWAKHDGHQLAAIMAEDVDFVTVGGAWFHGRADFEKYHTRLLAGRFRDSTNTPLDVVVRFLRPDEVVVHWSWTIEGDKNPDGSPRAMLDSGSALVAATLSAKSASQARRQGKPSAGEALPD